MYYVYTVSRQTHLTRRLKTIHLPYSCPVYHITNQWWCFLLVFWGALVFSFVCLFFVLGYFTVLIFFLCTGDWIIVGSEGFNNQIIFSFLQNVSLQTVWYSPRGTVFGSTRNSTNKCFFDRTASSPSCLPLLDPLGIPQWVFLLWHNLLLFQLSHLFSSSCHKIWDEKNMGRKIRWYRLLNWLRNT